MTSIDSTLGVKGWSDFESTTLEEKGPWTIKSRSRRKGWSFLGRGGYTPGPVLMFRSNVVQLLLDETGGRDCLHRNK